MSTEDRSILVGREDELAALRAALTEVCRGRPRTVLIEGPAGMGKTALVEQFLAPEQSPTAASPTAASTAASTEGDGARLLRASGERSEALVAYGVIDQLLRQAGIRATGLLTTRERALPPEEPVSVGTRLLEVLGHLERRGPLIVVIEDVHWVDVDSLRALLFALRRLASMRVLTLLTVRDEEVGRLPDGLRKLAREPTGRTLDLPPLTPGEVQRLGAHLGISDFSARTARRLHAHTRGNPLYVRALLTELPVDHWQTWEPLLPAPRAFAMQVHGRLEACATTTRKLVEAAATLATVATLEAAAAPGARVPLSIAAELAGLDDALPALEEAEVAGLLQLLESRDVVFRHPLVRAAVYERLGPVRRVALHRAAADLVPDEGGRLRHRVAASDPPDKALAADLSDFAERQIAAGVWGCAASALVEASRMSTTQRLREERLLRALDAMIASGDLVQASVFAGEAAGIGPGPYRDAGLGYLAILRGRSHEAEMLLRNAWRQCDPATDRRLAAITAERLALHAVGGLRGGDVVEWSRRAIELAPPGQPVRAEAEALIGLGLAWSGRLHEGIDAYQAVLEHEHALAGDLTAVGRIQLPLGWLWLVADDHERARSMLAETASTQLSLGSIRTALWAYVWLSRAEFLAGAWDAAVVSAARAVDLLEESGQRWLGPLVRWAAGSVPAARGDWEVAQEHARLGSAPAGGYQLMVLGSGMAAAQVAAARGDHEGVLRALAPVVEVRPLEGVDEPGFWPWAGLYGDALVSAGRLAEAEAFLGPQEQLAAARERRLSVAMLARVRGRLEAASGRAEAAEEAFGRGLAQLAGCSVPFPQGLLELAYGQVLRRHGRRRAAVEQLEAAGERFAGLGARPFVERCERELGASGLAPAKRLDFDPGRLTAQEMAVARLAGRGLSNRQVASDLFVSVKTVQFHLTRIYSKLRVSSRAELAATYAAELGDGPDAGRDVDRAADVDAGVDVRGEVEAPAGAAPRDSGGRETDSPG